MNAHPTRRYHRYRHEERAYRRDVWTRRTCIVLSLVLLLGTAWLLYRAGEPAGLPPDAGVSPGSLRAAQTNPPVGPGGSAAPRFAR